MKAQRRAIGRNHHFTWITFFVRGLSIRIGRPTVRTRRPDIRYVLSLQTFTRDIGRMARSNVTFATTIAMDRADIRHVPGNQRPEHGDQRGLRAVQLLSAYRPLRRPPRTSASITPTIAAEGPTNGCVVQAKRVAVQSNTPSALTKLSSRGLSSVPGRPSARWGEPSRRLPGISLLHIESIVTTRPAMGSRRDAVPRFALAGGESLADHRDAETDHSPVVRDQRRRRRDHRSDDPDYCPLPG